MQALGSIDGAPEGKPFYMDSVSSWTWESFVRLLSIVLV